MGIRFRCHHCDHELHVKDFQAGRRGRCPECGGKFRIPEQDAPFSLALHPTELSSSGVENSAESSASQSQDAQEREEVKKPAENRPATHQQPTRQTPKSQTASAMGQAAESGVSLESTIADPSPAGPPFGDAQLPKAIREAPAGVWYVRPTTGGQYGPAQSETFGQWLIEGRVSRDALVWRDDWPDWHAAGQVFNDYFGPESTAGISLAAGVAELATDNRESPMAPVTSLDKRNRIGRRQQKRRRYMMMLTVLTVLFICLVLALVFVLMRQ